MRVLIALAAVAVAAPAHAGFDPVKFFQGRTHGDGNLKIVFKRSVRMSVDSEGVQDRDGSLLLKQIVHEPGKPARTRYWRLRKVGNKAFEGTLTDAVGPVRVDVVGERVRIRYRAKDHLDFDQVLTQSGPRQVNNAMKVRRFGITVARFDEVIRKLD